MQQHCSPMAHVPMDLVDNHEARVHSFNREYSKAIGSRSGLS